MKNIILFRFLTSLPRCTNADVSTPVKTKHLKILLLFSILSSSGFCQDVDLNFSTSDKNPEQFHYVLTDSVNVRKCASLNCEKNGMLRIGQRMVLEKKSDNIDTINGIKSYWFYIRTEEINGWIFGGFIAEKAFGSLSDPSVKFVYGIKGIDTSEGWSNITYQVRAFKDNKEIDRIDFPIFTSYINEIKTIGSAGLKLEDVIVIDIPCEGGCGCSTGELVIFWNGKKFSKIENLLGTADAWASESKKFIYPSYMEGIENTVIKVSDYYIEEPSDNQIMRGLTKEYFKWNGSELIPDTTRKTETKTYAVEN